MKSIKTKNNVNMTLTTSLNIIWGPTLVILGYGLPWTCKHNDFQFYLHLGFKHRIFNTLGAKRR